MSNKWKREYRCSCVLNLWKYQSPRISSSLVFSKSSKTIVMTVGYMSSTALSRDCFQNKSCISLADKHLPSNWHFCAHRYLRLNTFCFWLSPSLKYIHIASVYMTSAQIRAFKSSNRKVSITQFHKFSGTCPLSSSIELENWQHFETSILLKRDLRCQFYQQDGFYVVL